MFSFVEKPYLAWKCLLSSRGEEQHINELGQSGQNGNLTKSTHTHKKKKKKKKDYGKSHVAKYIHLREWKQTPMWVCLGKEPLPFSHLGNEQMSQWTVPSANEPMCCTNNSVHWFGAGSFYHLKGIPNMFTFVEKPNLAWKCLLFTTGTNNTERARAFMAESHNLQKTRVWKLPHCKVYSTWWMNTSPNVSLLWNASLTLFQPRPFLYTGRMRQNAAQISLHWVCTGGFCHLNGTPNMFSFVQKSALAWKCLLFTNMEKQHIAS